MTLFSISTRHTPVYLSVALLLAAVLFSSNQIGVSGKSIVGCGGGGCHTYSINTTIGMTGIPASGYANGQTYTMFLTVGNNAKFKAGFNLSVSTGTLGAGAGMALVTPTELKHTAPLMMNNGNAIWSFTWTAPASGTTPVTFYAAGNAVDTSGTSSGDAFNTAQFNYTAELLSTAPIIANVITTGVTDTSFTATADVNPGNAATAPYIEYGLTTNYGSTTGMSPAILNGATPLPTNVTITGLTPGASYHYRIKASNANGTVYSPDKLVVLTSTPNAINTISIKELSVYPNPVHDVLYINGLLNEQIVNINVFNMQGVLMPTPWYANKPNSLQVSTLMPGNYLLQVQTKKGNYKASFVKW
jgi:hypothetical protein